MGRNSYYGGSTLYSTRDLKSQSDDSLEIVPIERVRRKILENGQIAELKKKAIRLARPVFGGKLKYTRKMRLEEEYIEFLRTCVAIIKERRALPIAIPRGVNERFLKNYRFADLKSWVFYYGSIFEMF